MMVDKNGGQPYTKSILPKINSFLVNTFLHSGSSNTAQIHPANTGNGNPEKQRDPPCKPIDTAENVNLVGAAILQTGGPTGKKAQLSLAPQTAEMPVSSWSTISSRTDTSDR